MGDSLSTLFLNRETSNLNKKILFGTLTRQPAKLFESEEIDHSRTLAALGVGGANTVNRTPMFIENSEEG